MAQYIHLFETASEFNEAYNGSSYEEPWVSLTEEGEKVNYNKSEEEKLLGTPLTFNIISGGTIIWKASYPDYTATIEYSTDNGTTWASITSSEEGTSISVNAGDTVQFRGDNAAYGNDLDVWNTFGDSTAKFEIEGNIMSLIDSTNFTTATTLASSYTFIYLFYNCTGLTSAENLLLPAVTLADWCYARMFQGCTSLVTAPSLPATTLAEACYYCMFGSCTSLTTAPELPATTLTQSCYDNMFRECASLTAAPELPAATLTSYCYQSMFKGCTSLITAPAIQATSLAVYCCSMMFYNCTSLETAPELLAPTLVIGCYSSMFYNCKKINYIKCTCSTNPSSVLRSTDSWLYGVASSGTVVAKSGTSWTINSTSGIPRNWTRINE